MSAGRVAASLLLLLGSGCIPSNVVAREERMVVDDTSALDWQPANGVGPPGRSSASVVKPRSCFIPGSAHSVGLYRST